MLLTYITFLHSINMYKLSSLRKTLLLLCLTTLGCIQLSAITIQPKYELINNTAFPTSDLAVATLNVLDYGADPTGKTDCSALFQQLLNYLGDRKNGSTSYSYNLAGGILYVPAGKYLCKNQLIIPRGVTLRGDWRKPARGDVAQGTVLIVDYGKGSTDLQRAFIVMQSTSEVSHIAFYYPGQSLSSVTSYPPTILYGQKGYWGNDYCNVRHCTFINSYKVINLNPYNGGGCPNIFDIYGSPLCQGFEMDNIADVGRFDGIDFAAWYWTESGMDNAPDEASLQDYLYNHATGVVMRRNDWSYICNYSADHYMVGFLAAPSTPECTGPGRPNGHNYNLRFTNCKTGLKVTGVSGAGAMFTHMTTDNCERAVELYPGSLGSVQLYGCDLAATDAVIYIDPSVSTSMMVQDSQLKGKIKAMGGQLVANANTCYSDAIIGRSSRTIFTGNRMVGSAQLYNNSIFECEVSDKAAPIRALPEYKDEWMAIKQTRPARTALYVVTDAEFGAQPVAPAKDNFSLSFDNTNAIQKALDKAGREGGGIVYLPSGHYLVNGTLTIPTGVELKGSSDLATVPKRNGAILETTANEGNEKGAPFITMQPASGLRGVTIDYPNNGNPVNLKTYPYAVRGNKDIYIVNLAIRTAYKGVDLFTNKCDNHYVDYLAGHAYTNVIRIGGNSEKGTVSNIQCNTIVLGCGDETKFGAWPNSMIMADKAMSSKAYGQNEEDLEFMMIGDCKDEVLYNNFLFGCNKGMWFVDDGNGGASEVHSLGNAVDGAVNTIVVDGIAGDLDLVNSQVVALDHKNEANIIKGELPAFFYTLGKNVKHAVTLFACDNWGGGANFAKVDGGQLNLYLGNQNASGSVATFLPSGNGRINAVANVFNNVRSFVAKANNDEPKLSITSSVVDANGASVDKMQAYANNLSVNWNVRNDISFLSRSGWKAYASNDVDGTMGYAHQAIDGYDETRWSTDASQEPGQYFMVDFGRSTIFNTLIFDTALSGNDGPAGYVLEISHSATGDNWITLEEGESAGAVLVFTSDKTLSARRVRIRQTGTKGNYWSIHEFNAAKLSDVNSVQNILQDEAFGHCVEVQIFNANGQQVAAASKLSTAVAGLPAGVYVAVARLEGQKNIVRKFIVR